MNLNELATIVNVLNKSAYDQTNQFGMSLAYPFNLVADGEGAYISFLDQVLWTSEDDGTEMREVIETLKDELKCWMDICNALKLESFIKVLPKIN